MIADKKRITVYLCGGIFQLSTPECTGWRDRVKVELGIDRFMCLDPMRRDYRDDELAHVDSIIHSDMYDIAQADVVLVNAVKPSWGTAMEVFHAFRTGKVVMAFNVPVPVSPWLYYHTTYRMRTLDEALALMKGWVK